MTTAKILKQYANEDLNTIIEYGSLAMTDNVYKTVIWFEYENKTFTATNSEGVLAGWDRRDDYSFFFFFFFFPFPPQNFDS